MKTAFAIICFIIAAISGVRSIAIIAIGIYLLFQPDNHIQIDVFVPRSVGMLLVPIFFLITGLVLLKKSRKSTPPPLS